MGLLDNFGSKVGTYLGDKENLLNLASGFASMSGNPNTASIMAGIQGQKESLMKRRDVKAAQDLATSQATGQRNATAEFLIGKGGEFAKIGQALKLQQITAKQAIEMAKEVTGRKPVDQFNILRPSEVAALNLDPNKTWQQNSNGNRVYELSSQESVNTFTMMSEADRIAAGLPEGSYQTDSFGKTYSIGKDGTKVIVNTGDSNSEAGPIPKGYEMFTDSNGVRRLQPIPGGEQAAEINAQVDRDASKQNTVGRTATIVLEDIGRLKDLLTEQTFLDPVTGPIASQVASGISASARANAESLVSTIGGNIGFDRLQLMRNESKTGGALGAINAQEMQLLQDVMGSLKLDQSEAQLRYNLERLESIYTAIIEKASAYPNAAKYGFSNNKTSAVSQTPASSKVTNSPPILTWNPTGGPNGKGAFE